MFVRFVAAAKTENPWHADGVITAARIVRDAEKLAAAHVEAINSAFAWFNENIPCPPFSDRLSRKLWTKNAVCWFLAEAEEPLARTWDLAQVLVEHGTPVLLLRTLKPGRIVYRDGFQIVAETPWKPDRGLVTAAL